jgi:alkanesulfonate monooxygenase SsuD/methylene tetrahydromethanopterin reductase-like flavin-dependent oxidoreductase (luciferase family)
VEFGIAIPQTYPDPVRIQRFLKRAEELPFAAVWGIEQVIGTAPVLESLTTLTYAAAVTPRATPRNCGSADRSAQSD